MECIQLRVAKSVKATLTFSTSGIAVIAVLLSRKIFAVIEPMYRNIHHTIVLIECILRSVAMVNVPVDNQHLADVIHALRMLGAQHDVVEEAETAGFLALGVMSRRPNDRYAVCDL